MVSGMSFDSDDLHVVQPERGWRFFFSVVLGNLSAMIMCLTGIATLGVGSILGGAFAMSNLGVSLALARSALGDANWFEIVGIHATFEIIAMAVAIAAGVFPLVATILSRLPLRLGVIFYLKSIAATWKPLTVVFILVIIGAVIEAFFVKVGL